MYRVSRIRLKSILLLLAGLIAVVILFEHTAKAMYPVKFEEYVSKYSEENELDPYLVFAIIKAESNFKKDAVSKKEARGLMQISASTGQWGAKTLKIEDYSTEKLFEPRINIQIGCWYLGKLFRQYGNADLVISAYNAGSGNVSGWLRDSDLSTDGRTLNRIPFPETDLYLKKVRNYMQIYKKLYEKGF